MIGIATNLMFLATNLMFLGFMLSGEHGLTSKKRKHGVSEQVGLDQRPNV